MNKMMAITISAGDATPAARGMRSRPNLALTNSPPKATVTSTNVPNSSLNSRRHS
jgi:hypothetical protein